MTEIITIKPAVQTETPSDPFTNSAAPAVDNSIEALTKAVQALGKSGIDPYTSQLEIIYQISRLQLIEERLTEELLLLRRNTEDIRQLNRANREKMKRPNR